MRFVAIVVATLLAGCGSGDAQKTATAITAAQSVGTGACAMFTATEAGAFIGESVDAGKDDGGGCQWTASDGSGDVIVAVVPAKNHEPTKGSATYRALPDIGGEGFVSKYLDGWIAGAIKGDSALRVSVAGNGASEATAIDLLRAALAKRVN